MLFYRSLIALTLFASTASGLDLLIKSVRCESRQVQVKFDYICNGDSLCTFGEIESMEGAFTYYGLKDIYNATADDYLVMDGNMYFFLTGYTHKQNMISEVPMPICNNALVADDSNKYGACPSDGKYAFDTVYNMPSIDSEYTGWAASGWSGEIVLDIYLNRTMDLVGKCTMKFETMVTGTYEEGLFRSTPSAKTVVLAVMGTLLVCLSLCLYVCCWKPRRRRRRDDPLLDEPEPDTAMETDAETEGKVSKISTILL